MKKRGSKIFPVLIVFLIIATVFTLFSIFSQPDNKPLTGKSVTSFIHVTSQPTTISISAKGSRAYNIWPIMELWLKRVDGTWAMQKSWTVNSPTFTIYNYSILLPSPGAYELAIVFPNDAYRNFPREDRNLYLDYLLINGQRVEAEHPTHIIDKGSRIAAFDNLQTVSAAQGALFYNSALRNITLAARQQTILCIDSDGGIISSIQGVVRDRFGNYTDYCSSIIQLVERACDFRDDISGHSTTIVISCPSGKYCTQGACVPVTRPTFNTNSRIGLYY